MNNIQSLWLALVVLLGVGVSGLAGDVHTEDWCVSKSELIKSTLRWSIENFSLRNEKPGQRLDSPIFPSNGNHKLTWFLGAFPRGDKDANNNHLSLFLYLKNTNTELPIKAIFNMSIINHKDELAQTFNAESDFDQIGTAYGNDRFISRSYLSREELVPGDRLTILCEVAVALDKGETTCDAKLAPVAQLSLRDQLELPLDTEKYSDVSFVVRGQKFKAHRAILAAKSPVFDELFNGQIDKKQEDPFEVHNKVSSRAFKELLRFIYEEKSVLEGLDIQDPPIDGEQFAYELWMAANIYQVDRLTEICEKFFIDNMRADFTPALLVLSNWYKRDELKKAVIKYIRLHENEVKQAEVWSYLVKDYPDLVNEALGKTE